ncbi:MAG: UDP-N-acetylmuramoyl-L-alanine--D-glutamate ligase [Patescibacteria group bacterium]
MKNKIAILGAGREGKSLKKYLLKTEKIKKTDVVLLDKKNNPNYLAHLEDYETIFRSPGIHYLNESLQAAINKGSVVSSATKLFFKIALKKEAFIIGITGTKGKTTIATLIYRIIRAAGKKTFLAGNIGKPMTDIINDIDKNTIAILELSSFQLQDLRVSPHISVVLDITPDHQDAHKNFKEYVEAKSNIAKHQNKNNIVIFSKSNQYSVYIANKSAGKKIGISLHDQDQLLSHLKQILKLPGKHNLKNAYFAAKIGQIMNISEKTILKTIGNFKGVPFRIQKIKNRPAVYNDSASTNPEATIAAIKAVYPDLLIMGGLNKNLSYAKMGKILKKSAIKAILLYGSNRKELIKNIPKNINIKQSSTLEDLFKKYGKTIKQCGTILFSPASASMDQFKNYKERGRSFNKFIEQYL